MVAPCNWQSGVSLAGKFFAAEVDIAASASLTIDAQGKASPQVIQVDEEGVLPPYAKTIMGANRCWRVQSADEVAFFDRLTGYLDPASQSISATSDGTVSDYSGLGGTFYAEFDGTPTLDDVVFAVDSETNIDVDIEFGNRRVHGQFDVGQHWNGCLQCDQGV